MSNRMKYVEEVINSDISIAVKYVYKLEEMMRKYLDRKYVIAVSCPNSALTLLKHGMGKEYDNKLITGSGIIKKIDSKIALYSFETDDKFPHVDRGALIATDDETIANIVQKQIEEIPDFMMNHVLAAIAVATIEDNGLL
jgi:dTDP-4-amino-4,6-dideoxygalactose transaminase